jgi:hypothetical protein
LAHGRMEARAEPSTAPASPRRAVDRYGDARVHKPWLRDRRLFRGARGGQPEPRRRGHRPRTGPQGENQRRQDHDDRACRKSKRGRARWRISHPERTRRHHDSAQWGSGGGAPTTRCARATGCVACSPPRQRAARRSTLDARRSTLDARRSTLDARRSTLKPSDLLSAI